MTNVSIHGAGWKWWLTLICTGVALIFGGWCLLQARRMNNEPNDTPGDAEAPEIGGNAGQQVPVEDEADDISETESDRWCRYKNCSISECSDPEFWQELNHIELSSSSSEHETDTNPNPVRDRLLEVLEGDHIGNRAIASWLFSRVNRRWENAIDEADEVMYTEMHYSLSVCLMNMTDFNTLPPFDRVRRIVMAHSNMAYDENSPSATLSVAEMRDQILASEVHAVEHYNGDGSLHHVSYTLVDELMANSDPIDAVGPEPMDVDQQGPMFGPPTHDDAMIEDIHERRARALEELNDRLQDAYNHGTEELVWSLQDTNRLVA